MGGHLLLWVFLFLGYSFQPAPELFRLHGGGVISAHSDIQDLEAQADISQLLMQMRCRLCMGHGRGVFTPELSGHFERGLGQFGQLLSALLQQMGWEVTYLPVDKYGIVQPDDLQSAMRNNTRLVSIMLANNEVGTIEPIKTLAAVAHAGGALFHTDAVQAVGHIPVNVNELGVDFLSLSAHKFGGPKGMGALYAKDGAISSFVDGGGQEMGRRSGTENVPGIIGTAVALMLADGLMLHNAQKVRHLRDRIIDELSSMDGVLVTGPDPGPMRLPGLASFIIDGVDSETLVMDLSAKGVCVSAGSACSSGTGKPSYVLRAMGYSEREAWSSLRVSLDDHITHDEVSELIQAIKSSIKVIRNQH